MSVEIRIPNRDSSKFVEGPTGFYTFPDDLIEDPSNSGLYEVPEYLQEDPEVEGVYIIPPAYIGVGNLPLYNIKNFSVQEDATPIEPSSSFGGVGQISFGINESHDTPLMLGEITLVDGSRGKTSGSITSLSSSNGDVSVNADSIIGLFNTERTVNPFVGTLSAAMQYYCNVVGIQNILVVDETIASRSVIYPGFVGNVWVHIKEILVKEQIEMALVFDKVQVRPLRMLTATLDRSVSEGWNLDNSNASKAIEIYYYNHSYGTQREIYPLSTEEPVIYSVGAGETQTYTVRLNASVVSVNQPSVQDFVGNRSYAGTNGVYAITGSDNLPVTAAQWTAQGGKLVVNRTDDPSVIEIVLTGASMPEYAPYRVAVSSGAGNNYNSLHITATAVAWDKKLITIPTGATNVTTSNEIGATIDNPFISTPSQAYSLGIKAAQAHAGLTYTVSGTALDINRSGEGQDLVQATIEDFNDYVPLETTIAEFNSDWLGQTIAQFNEFWQDRVDDLFPNQLFGNAPGARVLKDEANFRVTSVTTTEESVQFNASLDTLISDFNELWDGATIEDFNLSFVGYTCKDFSIVPLRRD